MEKACAGVLNIVPGISRGSRTQPSAVANGFLGACHSHRRAATCVPKQVKRRTSFVRFCVSLESFLCNMVDQIVHCLDKRRGRLVDWIVYNGAPCARVLLPTNGYNEHESDAMRGRRARSRRITLVDLADALSRQLARPPSAMQQPQAV